MWNVINLHTNLFRRLDMPKMTKVRYWLPSLGGSGVILFQIAAVEKFSEKQKQPLWDYQEDGSSSSPGTSLDQSMMEFILSKVTRIRWSKTLLKTNIIPGQHQEFCCYFKSIIFFASSLLRTTNLFFSFRKNCCYLCRFYNECAFDLLIWLVV